jgi:WD40 repeat protein
VVVIWDVATGKRLMTLETDSGYRGTLDYFFISPDWRRLFAWREKRKAERLEQDGKPMVRWTFDGAVRVWDLATGQVVRTYQHQPPRNIRMLRLSPDGTKFVTFEDMPGLYERGRLKSVVSLWDVKTGQYRTLPDGLAAGGTFSPDGRTLAAVTNQNGQSRSKLFDTITGRETLSLPGADNNAQGWVAGFSQDGRLVFGVERAKMGKAGSPGLYKWWDAATGGEVTSFPGDKDDAQAGPCLSPDGRRLAAFTWLGQEGQVFLYSVPEKRLLRTVPFGQNMKGTRLIPTGPVFSPDGRWLAIMSQSLPEDVNDDTEAFDVPQPRITLIETAGGEVRETVVAPQAFSRSLCFSPDGRTLAVGGYGRVLLWDLTKVQAPADQTRRP